MNLSIRRLAAVAATCIFFTSAAFAGSITLTNKSTTGQPTWNRPLAGTPPTGLSGVGTAVPYDVVAFSVGTSGTYSFLAKSTTTPVWDNFTFLYQTSFNASAPLTNVLVGNDDMPTIGLSGFSAALTAGVQYFFVNTGFANTDFGTYSLTIGSANPLSIVLQDTTTGGPTWNRPLAGTPPTGLSGVGTATPYDVTSFSVDTAGLYRIQSTALSTPVWDNFTFLYQNAFNASTPLTNALVGNDDNPTIGLSGFNRSLTAGTNYFHVETGFSNTDSGRYGLAITEIIPVVTGVPEPETIALIGIALVGLGLTRRRARAR